MNNWELVSTMFVAIGIVVTATSHPRRALLVAIAFGVLAWPLHSMYLLILGIEMLAYAGRSYQGPLPWRNLA